MTEFETKPNTGFIFKNKFKKDQTHPDLKGDVYLDKQLIEQLIKESKGNIIKIHLGCYSKKGKDGHTFLSVYASKPFIKPTVAHAFTEIDDDLPF
jgi:kynurenine formamidase